MKIGVTGSPISLASVSYRESFSDVGVFHFDDQMQGRFMEVFAEFVVLSTKICRNMEANFSIFAQYTQFYANGGVTLIDDVSATASQFDFKSSPNLAVVGFKASLAF